MHLTIVFLLACCHFFGSVLAQKRQYGGYDVTASEFPFVVAIAFGSNLTGNGAILAPKWILSTADAFLKQPLSEYEAYAGGDSLENGERYRNERIHPHQESNGYIDNIALMKLNRELRFGPTIMPIRMLESNPDGMEVLMLSYGKNEDASKHLRAAQYILASDAACVAHMEDERAKSVIREGEGYCMYPTGDNKPTGQWYTDTGAPLVLDERLVALWGLRVDDSISDYNNVSIATRITAYRAWIESTMKL